MHCFLAELTFGWAFKQHASELQAGCRQEPELGTLAGPLARCS